MKQLQVALWVGGGTPSHSASASVIVLQLLDLALVTVDFLLQALDLFLVVVDLVLVVLPERSQLLLLLSPVGARVKKSLWGNPAASRSIL